MSEAVNTNPDSVIRDIATQPICELRINGCGHIYVGLGKRTVPVLKKLEGVFNGEWGIGCFHLAWKVFKEGECILRGCKSGPDYLEREAILQHALKDCFVKDVVKANGDSVHVLFTGDQRIEFYRDPDEEDIMHIFCPPNQVLFYNVAKGWMVEPSRK